MPMNPSVICLLGAASAANKLERRTSGAVPATMAVLRKLRRVKDRVGFIMWAEAYCRQNRLRCPSAGYDFFLLAVLPVTPRRPPGPRTRLSGCASARLLAAPPACRAEIPQI